MLRGDKAEKFVLVDGGKGKLSILLLRMNGLATIETDWSIE